MIKILTYLFMILTVAAALLSAWAMVEEYWVMGGGFVGISVFCFTIADLLRFIDKNTREINK